MFRKFLLACMVMAAFTMQIQAISINELNSSSQFKNVYQKSYPYEGASIQNKLISYLNTYSVESLEYAAPHYKKVLFMLFMKLLEVHLLQNMN